MCRWNRLLLAALIVLITFLYPLLAPTPHRIDQAHADLIVQGMTKERVEAIFGVPAGEYDWAKEDYRDHFRVHLRLVKTRLQAHLIVEADQDSNMPLGSLGAVRKSPQTRAAWTSLTWTSRHGSFTMWFDENERVLSTNAWTDVHVVPPWHRWWIRYWNK